jgi:hypothetical protein
MLGLLDRAAKLRAPQSGGPSQLDRYVSGNARRALNMLGEDANNVAFEARRIIVQVGGYSLDRIAMGQKLCLPRDAWRALCVCQFIHRGITDLALHRFAIVHHRKCKRQSLVVVSYDLATHERHGNPHSFKAAVLRPDWLACRTGYRIAIRAITRRSADLPDHHRSGYVSGPVRIMNRFVGTCRP